MNNSPEHDEPIAGSQGTDTRIVIGVGLLLMVVGFLIVLAVVLAINANAAAPSVRILRDLLIIFMSLEIVIVGAAVTIFVIQLARLVNLIRNEIEPLVSAATETVNTVRGTAMFLSKNLVEPVTSVSSVLRGVGKVAGDVDAIRKAAGIIVEVASGASSTGAVGRDAMTPANVSSPEHAVHGRKDSSDKVEPRKRKSSRHSKEE